MISESNAPPRTPPRPAARGRTPPANRPGRCSPSSRPAPAPRAERTRGPDGRAASGTVGVSRTSVGPSPTAFTGTLSAMPPSSAGRPPYVQTRRERRRARRGEHEVRERLRCRAVAHARVIGSKTEAARKARMRRRRDRVLERVGDSREGEGRARPEPCRLARDRHDDVRSAMKARECGRIDGLEQRTPVHRPVREHRLAAEPVRGIGVAPVRTGRGLEMREGIRESPGEQHARHRRTGARRCNARGRETEVRRGLGPEARLPHAAISAAREHDGDHLLGASSVNRP